MNDGFYTWGIKSDRLRDLGITRDGMKEVEFLLLPLIAFRLSLFSRSLESLMKNRIL